MLKSVNRHMHLKFSKTLLAGLLPLIVSTLFAVNPAYLDDSKPIEERVEDALSRMTLEEKVAMCHAQARFSSKGVPRLGIPDIWTANGPHGVAFECQWDSYKPSGWTNDAATGFPALICLGATFDPDMAFLYGQAVGEEARYRNKEILLGPGFNIYRTPLNGRNFEYTGEDPCLSSRLAPPFIQAVQKNGVAVCVKHFAVHSQETSRFNIDVIIDERAMHEIYLPAFKAAIVDGKAWSVMCAYNRINGVFCSENDMLLNGILKKDWGFDGPVVSDWGAAHHTERAARGGLDIEMGTSENADKNHLGTPFLKALQERKLPEALVDEKVRRILRLVFRTGMNRKRPWGNFATREHADVSRKIAEAGIVLMKNDGNLLPLDAGNIKSIAVIGENADKTFSDGGGSAAIKPSHEITALEGIKAAFPGIEIIHAKGYSSDPKTENKRELLDEAVKAASEASVVLYFGGLNHDRGQDMETADRKSFELPYEQSPLIDALSKANKNVVIILMSGNAAEMPWVDRVPAIIQGWYLGSESGTALANVIKGSVNPSGKLPISFPARLEDNAAHSFGPEGYPGINRKVHYKEGILVGYRWHDTKNIKPLFPFGHGLSYTTFAISDIKADKANYSLNDTVHVTCKVSNTGKRAGAEVIQVYVRDVESSVPRPLKELKGFKKVYLEPGESKEISIDLKPDAFAFYSPETRSWTVEPGEFRLMVGNSSSHVEKDIPVHLNN